MKTNSLALLGLCACAYFGTDQAQAAISGAPVVWGDVYLGLTNVPVEAQSNVVALSAGETYVAALRSDGSVVAWGRFDSPTNVPAFAQGGVTAIAAGQAHLVALKDDGSVVAWGNNSRGTVTGTPDTNSSPLAAANPVTLGGEVLSGITAVAAATFHSVALRQDGRVVAWGLNIYGQTTVPAEAQSGVVAIAAGHSHTVALKADGRVITWGSPEATRIPVAAEDGVMAIASGGYHTLALKNGGRVIAWGLGNYGQTNVPLAAQSGVTAIAAGTHHSVALRNDGTVVVWGNGSWGQTNVPVVARSGTLSIAAGGNCSLAIVNPAVPSLTAEPMGLTVNAGRKTSFAVAATGYPLNFQWRRDGTNLLGAVGPVYRLDAAWFSDAGTYSVIVGNSLGTVTSTAPAVLVVNPVRPGSVVTWPSQWEAPAEAQSGVVAIAAGLEHTVALTTNGSVVTWREYGGYEFEIDFESLMNVPVAAGSGVTAIAAGFSHTVALKSDGRVIAWGRNDNGESTVPDTVQGGVIAIAAGGDNDNDPSGHTLALTTNGAVLAWGKNRYGQATVPGAAQSGVTAIAAGGYHSAALKIDGRVVTWGYGQPGIPPAAQSGVTAIAAGGLFTVALKADGRVIAWGHNPNFPSVLLTNVPVAAQRGVVAIAVSPSRAAALKNDGSVVAWSLYSWLPETLTPPAAERGVTAIAAGVRHIVALLHGPVPMQARTVGNELALTWPVSGYLLQATPDLTPPVLWSEVTNTPTLWGAHWAVTNILSGNAMFYRLRQQ